MSEVTLDDEQTTKADLLSEKLDCSTEIYLTTDRVGLLSGIFKFYGTSAIAIMLNCNSMVSLAGALFPTPTTLPMAG